MKKWLILFGPMLATTIGLAVVLLTGLASWPLARGLPGIAIGLNVSVLFACLMRWKAGWPISLIASGIGAVVACFFAISTAEVLPPGSIRWMWQGGLYGAAFGIPAAVLLSPLALLEQRQSAV
ncbi:hypothetical protein [Rubripirellula reticaptiva]|uniref:hypothetical protein n=1 Tax=Rubripirellula reticaptiva TaxID=2528013 RepID=UPI001648A8AB|nr:hypothetical protein [Rubripirellula reticaptiva]